MRSIVLCLCFLLLFSCKKATKETQKVLKVQPEMEVILTTNYGEIVLKLYNETPLHRDNFIKLVQEKRYDSLLFHRVIENFMIQSGDPDSKNALAEAELGNGDLPYTVPAEFHPDLFHKRGALGAARNGNIARASSAMQFYIVQGRKYTDSTILQAQGRINKWLAENKVVNDPNNKEWASVWGDYAAESKTMSQDSIELLRSRIDSLATVMLESKEELFYEIPETHRKVYTSQGGAAHLDQNYTVFGEIVSGMSVIDSIAAARTNEVDRPLEDVRILSAVIRE